MSKWFQIIGRLEGVSFLLLLAIAVPLKYLAHWPMGVRIIGPLHGVLFIAYCALILMMAALKEWPVKIQIFAFLAAVFPFGTFIFEKKFLSLKAT